MHGQKSKPPHAGAKVRSEGLFREGYASIRKTTSASLFSLKPLGLPILHTIEKYYHFLWLIFDIETYSYPLLALGFYLEKAKKYKITMS